MKRRVNWDTKNKDYKTESISKVEMDNEFTVSKHNGVWTERAGELIIALTENVCFSPYFRLDNKMFIIREAMIDHVIMYILDNGLRLYDPKKGKAFSYFTSVVFSQAYDFLRHRMGDKKTRDIYGSNIRTKDEFGNKVIAQFVEYKDDEYYGED